MQRREILSKTVFQAPLLLQLSQRSEDFTFRMSLLRQCDEKAVKWWIFEKSSAGELARPLLIVFIHQMKT